MIEGVTFDFWNTLVYEEPGHLRGLRIDAWLTILEQAGVATERERLEALFEASWQSYLERWKAGEQFQATEAAGAIVAALDLAVAPEVGDALVAAFTDAGRGAHLHLADGIEACLGSLRAAGLRIGIVCDVGMTASPLLRAHLERHRILGLFDHWSFSDEVGAYKPSRAIFEHALAGLGALDPARVAHVGDLRRTDVAGALGMGMTAVRYTGVFDDDTQPEPEGHHVLADHADLPAALGVA